MECIIATTQKHYYDQVRIRSEVFHLEQNVPIIEEIDELDNEAIQFIVYEKGIPIGAARFRLVDGRGKVERVCVIMKYRIKGVGRLIMSKIEDYAQSIQVNKLILNAQLSALPFYEKLGYIAYGDIFLDANIEHKSMCKEIK